MTAGVFPTLVEWRRVHQAAAAFRKLAPWEWMTDDQCFAIQPPEAGETGYCCVLGALGQVLGLVVYPGAEGFASLTRLRGDDAALADPDLPYAHRCLIASFEPREALTPEDRAVIRQLGLRFRGRDAWPLFRSHRPGYHPWFVDPAELRLLASALEAGAALGTWLQHAPERWNFHDRRRMLTLLPAADGAGWRTGWSPPPQITPPSPPLPHLDEVRLQRMRKQLTPRETPLEFDWFYVPNTVLDRERPYYPRAVALVEAGSELAVGVELLPPEAGIGEIAGVLLKALERSGGLPRHLRVRRADLAAALEPLAGRLRIVVQRHKRLAALEVFQRHLLQHFAAGA